METPTEDSAELARYERVWRGYKWRVVAFLAAWCVVPALAALLAKVLDKPFGGFLGFGALGLFLGTGIRLTVFKCPRCREPFFMSAGFFRNPFAKKCMRCGLPKWATDSSGTEAKEPG
ncbi:MAG TPA: hypothetical protein VGK67_17725 [Myxococcales bacterium]|jgi:hypothetical protein